MRYNQEHKERSRHRILFSAAHLMRKHGVGNVSIAQVMADAGLTHGAFYAHFSSKDELAEQALATALNDGYNRLREAVRKAVAQHESVAEAVIDFYLTERNLESAGRGCALSCVAQEVARGDAGGRDVMLVTLDEMAALIGPYMEGVDDAARRARAHSLYASLVGTMTLCRLYREPAERAAQMEAARGQLRQSFNPPSANPLSAATVSARD